jgi:hypothetical protein
LRYRGDLSGGDERGRSKSDRHPNHLSNRLSGRAVIMSVYEKPSNIEISLKDGKEAIFRNTKTNNEWTYTKKPVVEIAVLFEKHPQWRDSQIAKRLHISETEVIGLVKPLIKKGHLSELGKKEILFD